MNINKLNKFKAKTSCGTRWHSPLIRQDRGLWHFAWQMFDLHLHLRSFMDLCKFLSLTYPHISPHSMSSRVQYSSMHFSSKHVGFSAAASKLSCSKKALPLYQEVNAWAAQQTGEAQTWCHQNHVMRLVVQISMPLLSIDNNTGLSFCCCYDMTAFNFWNQQLPAGCSLIQALIWDASQFNQLGNVDSVLKEIQELKAIIQSYQVGGFNPSEKY